MSTLATILYLFFAVGLLAERVAAQEQAPSSDSARGGKKTAEEPYHTSFKCPDPLAAEACKYFAELFEAEDAGLRRSFIPSTVLVCFRQNSESFFVFELENARFSATHETTALASGHANAFNRGVADPSSPPNVDFRGVWTAAGPTFVATIINQEVLPDSDDRGISVDPEQIIVSWRYRNPSANEIDYRLTVQRSTGRFSESFTEKPSQYPFLEKHGRCSRLPLRRPTTKHSQ